MQISKKTVAALAAGSGGAHTTPSVTVFWECTTHLNVLLLAAAAAAATDPGDDGTLLPVDGSPPAAAAAVAASSSSSVVFEQPSTDTWRSQICCRRASR